MWRCHVKEPKCVRAPSSTYSGFTHVINYTLRLGEGNGIAAHQHCQGIAPSQQENLGLDLCFLPGEAEAQVVLKHRNTFLLQNEALCIAQQDMF